MKFIIVAGFFLSGSSAAVDLLEEFDNTYVCNGEVRLISDPYGIRMLEESLVNHWTPIRSTAAISDFLHFAEKCSHAKSRFPLAPFGMGYADSIHPNFMEITTHYIESLTMGTYYQDYYFNKAKKNYFSYVTDRCRLGLQHHSKNRIRIAKKYKCYFARPTKEEFEQRTREYMDSLFGCIKGKEFVVLDQGVHIFDADVIDRYFNDAKMIVIDRDWRDIYISSVEHHGVVEPDVFAYIRKQEITRETHYNSPNILRLSFEEMVTDYDNSVQKIMAFCGLKEPNHVRPRECFDPDRSSKNVGIWKRFYAKYPQVMNAISDYYSAAH